MASMSLFQFHLENIHNSEYHDQCQCCYHGYHDDGNSTDGNSTDNNMKKQHMY